MKKLLTTFIFALTLFSTQSAYSQCCLVSEPHVAIGAIEDFMAAKLDIPKEDIVHMEQLSSKRFSSVKTKALATLFSPVMLAAAAIEKGVSVKDILKEVNQTDVKYKYTVQFNRGHEFCTVDLKVKVKMLYLTTDCQARSTTVKQKYRPVCN